jgi:hypothetical protein
MTDEPEPTTQELRLDQIQREREEHARLENASTPEEAAAAARRADKAAYLKDKLTEQEERTQP